MLYKPTTTTDKYLVFLAGKLCKRYKLNRSVLDMVIFKNGYNALTFESNEVLISFRINKNSIHASVYRANGKVYFYRSKLPNY